MGTLIILRFQRLFSQITKKRVPAKKLLLHILFREYFYSTAELFRITFYFTCNYRQFPAAKNIIISKSQINFRETQLTNVRASRKHQSSHIKPKRYLKSFTPFCKAQATLQMPAMFYTYFKLSIIVLYFNGFSKQVLVPYTKLCIQWFQKLLQ